MKKSGKSLFVRVSEDMHATIEALTAAAGESFVSDYIRGLLRDKAIAAGLPWNEADIAAPRDIDRMLQARGINKGGKADGKKKAGAKAKVPDAKGRGKAVKG